MVGVKRKIYENSKRTSVSSVDLVIADFGVEVLNVHWKKTVMRSVKVLN